MVKVKKFFPKFAIVQIIAVPLIVLLCALVYVFGVHSTVRRPVTFDVVAGDSVSGVANRLFKNKLIDSVKVFKTSVRLNGGKVQIGQYDIPSGASTWRIANMLANGDVDGVFQLESEGMKKTT